MAREKKCKFWFFRISYSTIFPPKVGGGLSGTLPDLRLP